MTEDFPPRLQMAAMTTAEAGKFLRQIAETTAHASQNWDNFQSIAESMFTSAMDAGRQFGHEEAEPVIRKAALTDLRTKIAKLERIVPAHMPHNDETWNRNGEYVSLDSVLALLTEKGPP